MKDLKIDLFGKVILGIGKNKENEPYLVTSHPPCHGQIYYTCMNHPDVIQQTPGLCPKCHSTLVQVCREVLQMNEILPPQPGWVTADSSLYGKVIIALDQEGDGNNDKIVLYTLAVQKCNGITYYTCRLHPDVQQDTPGICHRCGLTLIKVCQERL